MHIKNFIGKNVIPCVIAEKFGKRFRKFIAPFTIFLYKHGIKPNFITTLGLILLPVAFYSIIFLHNRWLFLALFITISFLDALDGAIAKNCGHVTKFGGFYDSFVDRVVEGIVYLSLAIAYEELYILCFIALLSSYLTSYVASWERSVKYTGIGSRAERMVVLIIAIALNQLFYGLIIITILSIITIFERSWQIYKKFRL